MKHICKIPEGIEEELKPLHDKMRRFEDRFRLCTDALKARGMSFREANDTVGQHYFGDKWEKTPDLPCFR